MVSQAEEDLIIARCPATREQELRVTKNKIPTESRPHVEQAEFKHEGGVMTGPEASVSLCAWETRFAFLK